MQLKTLILTGLLGVLTACAPMHMPTLEPTLTPTPSETATAEPTATEMPVTETSTPEPTATVEPTATEMPSSTGLWRIWFEGFNCAGNSVVTCGDYWGASYSYFSIMSDGSGLESLGISALPGFPKLPDWVALNPGEKTKRTYLSPDGRWLAYTTADTQFSRVKQLYVADLANKIIYRVYTTSDEADTQERIGAVCWSPDSQKIWFTSAVGYKNVFYDLDFRVVNRDGSGLKIWFSDDYENGILYGVCSPDATEMVLVQRSSVDDYAQGLYRFSLLTGRKQQILSKYFIVEIENAPNDFQP